jgi:hypothetical protein
VQDAIVHDESLGAGLSWIELPALQILAVEELLAFLGESGKGSEQQE